MELLDRLGTRRLAESGDREPASHRLGDDPLVAHRRPAAQAE